MRGRQRVKAHRAPAGLACRMERPARPGYATAHTQRHRMLSICLSLARSTKPKQPPPRPAHRATSSEKRCAATMRSKSSPPAANSMAMARCSGVRKTSLKPCAHRARACMHVCIYACVVSNRCLRVRKCLCGCTKSTEVQERRPRRRRTPCAGSRMPPVPAGGRRPWRPSPPAHCAWPAEQCSPQCWGGRSAACGSEFLRGEGGRRGAWRGCSCAGPGRALETAILRTRGLVACSLRQAAARTPAGPPPPAHPCSARTAPLGLPHTAAATHLAPHRPPSRQSAQGSQGRSRQNRS